MRGNFEIGRILHLKSEIRKFLIGLRLTESNLRFRNFGFEMGFCPISQFPRSDHPVCAASVASRHFFVSAASPLKELGGTHWPARVSNPFAEREFVACADGVFGYELQALQKQFHHKAAEF